jgi:hypothetical protein
LSPEASVPARRVQVARQVLLAQRWPQAALSWGLVETPVLAEQRGKVSPSMPGPVRALLTAFAPA